MTGITSDEEVWTERSWGLYVLWLPGPDGMMIIANKSKLSCSQLRPRTLPTRGRGPASVVHGVCAPVTGIWPDHASIALVPQHRRRQHRRCHPRRPFPAADGCQRSRCERSWPANVPRKMPGLSAWVCSIPCFNAVPQCSRVDK